MESILKKENFNEVEINTFIEYVKHLKTSKKKNEEYQEKIAEGVASCVRDITQIINKIGKQNGRK